MMDSGISFFFFFKVLGLKDDQEKFLVTFCEVRKWKYEFKKKVYSIQPVKNLFIYL